jgi:hypothetical protein
VGSILTSVEEGQKIARADELGYFAFGEHQKFLWGDTANHQVDLLSCCCSRKVLLSGTKTC